MALRIIHTRQVSHQYTVVTPTPGPGGANPWNLETAGGGYHACFVVDGKVTVKTSDFGGPPFSLEAVGIGSGASYPRLAEDSHKRLWLTYQTSAGAMVCRSDDDGQTWEEAALAITGGSKPTVAAGHDGTIILAAVVGTAIKARVRQPGDAEFGTAYNLRGWNGSTTADFVVQDDTFHLQQERGPNARWWLHVLLDGESATSNWWSADLDSSDATFTRGT